MRFHPSGTRIAGRYEVAGLPLVGGMGVVYLCFDHQEQRPIALKTFKPEFLPDRAARERFLEEGNTWMRLGKHPHIVRCYQVFQDSPRPEVYLVRELVAKEEGRRDASLRSWLTQGQPLPTDQALLIALQIVRGMRYATERIPGFAHRDLKPENVLVGADRLSNAPINRVRVTDFGLVKGLRVEQVSQAQGEGDFASRPGQLTRAGSVLGTPAYMAPEQWEGADVTVQADIYALGCILGEMLIGRTLVQGGMVAGYRTAHREGGAMAAAAEAVEELNALLAGCLAVEQGKRYLGWEALEAALDETHATVVGKLVPSGTEAGTLNPAERVAMGLSYSAIGLSYMDIGEARTALNFFEQARAVGAAENEGLLEAVGLGNLGNACLALGNPRRAIRHCEHALAIYQESYVSSLHGAPPWRAGRRGEGVALAGLGSAYRELGDAQRAIGYYEAALAIAREISDRQDEGAALTGLGLTYVRLGDARRAIAYHEAALAIAREISDLHGEGANLSSLGGAYLDLGDARLAVGCFEQSLAIAREIGDRRSEGAELGNLGLAYAHLGNTHRAIDYYEQSVVISRETGDRQREGNALGNLSQAFRKLGDLRRTIEYSQHALAIHREIGHRWGEGDDLGVLGMAYADLGDAGRAIGYYEQALAIHREISDTNGVAFDFFNMAFLYAKQGDVAKALPLAEEAARLWDQIAHTTNAQTAQQLVALLTAA